MTARRPRTSPCTVAGPRDAARPLAAVALSCALLTACGQDARDADADGRVRAAPSTTAPDEPTADAPTAPGDVADPRLVRDGELLLTCGPGEPFPVSVLRDGVPGLVDPAEVVAALEGLRERTTGEGSVLLDQAPSAADVPHRVVGVDAQGDRRDVVVLLGDLLDGGERPLLDVVRLAEDDGGWRATGSGGCEVQPVLPDGLDPVEVAAPPGGLDRSSTTLAVVVSERSCVSGRDPEPFLRQPAVIQDEASVTLVWTAEAARGAQNCVGNPRVSRTVDLDAPLGDRALLDGRTWPPVALS